MSYRVRASLYQYPSGISNVNVTLFFFTFTFNFDYSSLVSRSGKASKIYSSCVRGMGGGVVSANELNFSDGGVQ